MQLRKTYEDYLEAMLILQKRHGYIRSVDIAIYLSVTKPSVSSAVKHLRANGYVEMEYNGTISFTQAGLAVAESVYEKHLLISRLLMNLGVDEKTAAEDACRVEHDISSESFEAIKRLALLDIPCSKLGDKHLITMSAVSRAMHKLNALGPLTVDMHQAFIRGNVSALFYCTDDAILIRHSCGIYMLWAATKKAGLDALSHADDDIDCCVTHGKPSLDAMAEFKPEFTIDPPCYQYCLNSRVQRPLEGIAQIRPLRTSEAELVVQHYSMEHDVEHIRNLIRNGKMFGAEVDGKLAAFIGFHRDGSSGMLEVIPEFRRKGIGTELEVYFQNYQLEKGWMPYGQVYLTNTASLKMQSKLGLAVSGDFIWWVFNEGGTEN